MNLLLKHTLRSLRSNKGQIFVIILTITIIVAMVFIGLSMFDIFYNIQMAEFDRIANGADMLVGSHSDSDELYSKARLDNLLDEKDIKDIKHFTKFGSVLKTESDTKTVLVEATDLKTYLEKNPIRYIEKYDPKTANINDDYWFYGKDLKIIDIDDYRDGGDTNAGYPLAIIDSDFAKKSNIKAGDIVEVFIPTFSSYTKMKVGFVALKEGIFSSPASKNILVDFSSIENMSQLTSTYITFNDPNCYAKYKDLIEKEIPAVKVTEGNSYEYVMDIVRNNTLLLSIAIVILLATMMIILYSTYVIIAKHRVKDLIIFKTAGATPKQVIFILLLEIFTYVVIGVVFGLLFGRFIFSLALKLILPQVMHAIKFPFWKYLVSICITLLATVLATIGVIYSVSKKTITELKQDTIKIAKVSKPIFYILSILALIVLTIVYFVVDIPLATTISGYLIVIFVVALVIFSSGHLFNLFAKLTRKTPLALSGYASTRSSAVKNLATLLALIIAFSFVVVQLVGIVKVAVVPFNSRYTADYVVTVQKPADEEEIKTFNNDVILKVKGVTDSTYYNTVNFLYPENDNPDPSHEDMSIYGISDKKHLQYSTKDLDPQTYERWDKTQNPIVLSNDVMLRLNLKIGDTVVFTPFAPDFRSEPQTFTVVGIDYYLSQWDQIGYAKYEQLSRMSQPLKFMIQSDEDVFIDLRAAVENAGLKQTYALKFNEWAYIDKDTNTGISYLLAFVQTLIYIVAIIGILNMAIMTSYNRQNELDIYKISGMSNSDFLKFSFGEGLLIVSTGGILGIIASFFINLATPMFYNIINKYVKLTVFPYEILIVFLVATVLFLCVWMLIALSNKKRSISSFNKRFNE